MTIQQELRHHATIRPVRPENRVVWVQKREDGGLLCRQSSGNEFTIPPEDDVMQAFVIMTMLDDECTSRAPAPAPATGGER